jgi:hypothetical protein
VSEKRTECLVSDCDRPHWARGLCSRHYNRWYRGEHLPTVRSQQQAPPLALSTSEVDLGYLTALLDREGTITQTTHGDYWRVSVNNTDKEIIDWLATIGGTTSSQSQGTKRKVMLIWTLANQKDVHDLLSAVLPYLKTRAKRDKAQRAVAEIATRDAPPLRPGRRR